MSSKKVIYPLLLLCFLSIIAIGAFILLPRDELQESIKPKVTATPLPHQEMVTRPSDDLLKTSISMAYPEGLSFTPLYLLNTNHIIGEALTLDGRHKQLLAISLDTGEQKVLKELPQPFEMVSFLVHAELDNHLIVEEFDQVAQISTYYDLSLDTGEYKIIHTIEDVTPVHLTQTAVQNSNVILSMYSPDIKGYKLYQYQIDTSKMEVIVDTNSGFPTFFKDHLYYISVDNTNHKTAIIQDNFQGSPTELLSLSSASEFLFGLYADGDSIIKLIYDNNTISLSSLTEDKPLFQTEWMETVRYKNGFLSYLGDGDEASGYRLKYYLLDLKHHINYEYANSVMLLSDNGIFWVEYKKDISQIEKGQIFTNDNSVMRFYPFP